MTIPQHLIDKAVRAQIVAEGRDPDGHCEQWKYGCYGHDVRIVLEAVAADIWDDGYDACEGDVENANWHAVTPNPYRPSETA